MKSQKSINLFPSRKAWFWWYLLGVVLIPFLGAGIYLIYRIHKSHSAISIKITDTSITYKDSKFTEQVDLANIKNVDVEISTTYSWFNLGDLILKTETRSVKLPGMEDPEPLAEMIRRAAESERMRLTAVSKNKSSSEPEPSIRRDRLDYLTGLWQQGLISNEDFENEKKYFE